MFCRLFFSLLLVCISTVYPLTSQDYTPYVMDCTGIPSTPCYFKGFFFADLLYWRPYESKLDICIPDRSCDSLNFKGKGREPRFEWNPGFRIGLGYLYNDFDFLVTLTHFHSSTKHSDRLRWKIDFDSIDVLTGYEFDCTTCLAVRPFGGFRFARIDQELRHCRSDFYWKNHEDFSGVGPVLGLDGNWSLGCGFNFYVNAAISWLYGNFHLHLNQSENLFDEIHHFKNRSRLTACLPVFDASAGIRWQAHVCQSLQFFFQLGLEHHAYYNYNRVCDCGDLNFDGVNFSVGFAF